MNDFAPHIYRQRLIIEGIYGKDPTNHSLDEAVSKLSKLLGLSIVYGPQVMQLGQEKGFEVITVWAESGCQLYTWEDSKFFTVDIYSCKQFDPMDAYYFFLKEFDCKEIDMRVP